ncbi:hypothetical protein RMN57_19060 [Kitasatospora sp. CM 4170]|uniref:Uncharacterized protein n=1 Tax=Kitasatospora aburaviensis TaxID=67265 RepID=A0ABW1F696_9ACTN|nr:hypothetical protein [Kitasatospora sp. CM 4170]WNM46655.1 hypothetical protein RMN57_19060 [Kitasatospora sp. CM 4170]
MSVYVKLSAEAREPAEPSKGPLDLQYEDDADGVTFEYDLHPSGVLRVLRVFEDTPHRIETCFGPGAWLQVVGTYLRSGSEY